MGNNSQSIIALILILIIVIFIIVALAWNPAAADVAKDNSPSAKELLERKRCKRNSPSVLSPERDCPIQSSKNNSPNNSVISSGSTPNMNDDVWSTIDRLRNNLDN